MPLHAPPAVPVPGQTPSVHTPASGHASPQSSAAPQPSPIVPQYCPPFVAVQVPFVQFAGTHTLFGLHTSPGGQSPQGSELPQPSPTVPQNWLPALPHVSGTQPACTHTLLVQVEPAEHAPQLSAWPQPSPIVPQNWVVPAVHVAGTQLAPPTQTLFSQLQSVLQFMPQSSVPLQPSPIEPQYCPPSGVHETDVLQLAASEPASGTLIAMPEPALPVCPLEPVAPALPVPPPLPVRTPLVGGEVLEQLALATSAAVIAAPANTLFSIAAYAPAREFDQPSTHNCRTFHATSARAFYVGTRALSSRA